MPAMSRIPRRQWTAFQGSMLGMPRVVLSLENSPMSDELWFQEISSLPRQTTRSCTIPQDGLTGFPADGSPETTLGKFPPNGDKMGISTTEEKSYAPVMAF